MKVLNQASGENWVLYQGDSCEVTNGLSLDSVGLLIYSLPFSNLYQYSDSERDMSNNTDKLFLDHYRFLASDLLNVTRPGRICAVHLMQVPSMKYKDGYIGLKDFRGDIIRAHTEAGWIYHSEVCIWADPVTQMQRTKAIGLLYKQVRKDSCMSRQGLPDYLCVFRKPGENAEPVTHTHESFPLKIWQDWASPIWMDINRSKTLQYRNARDEADQRHIAPLQLDVIERALMLWSNPGDVVFDPFGGIGSTGVVAIEMGRKAVLIELKKSYFDVACTNLRSAERSSSRQQSLFAAEEA